MAFKAMTEAEVKTACEDYAKLVGWTGTTPFGKDEMTAITMAVVFRLIEWPQGEHIEEKQAIMTTLALKGVGFGNASQFQKWLFGKTAAEAVDADLLKRYQL